MHAGAAPAVLGLQGTFLEAERGVPRYARAQAGALHARSRRVVAIDLADAAPESVRVALPPVPVRRAYASRRPAEGPIVYQVGSALLDLHMPLGESGRAGHARPPSPSRSCSTT